VLCFPLLCYLSCSLFFYFFFSSRRRHTRSKRDWSSDVCSSDLRLVLTSLVLCQTLEVLHHIRLLMLFPLLLLDLASYKSEHEHIEHKTQGFHWTQSVLNLHRSLTVNHSNA